MITSRQQLYLEEGRQPRWFTCTNPAGHTMSADKRFNVCSKSGPMAVNAIGYVTILQTFFEAADSRLDTCSDIHLPSFPTSICHRSLHPAAIIYNRFSDITPLLSRHRTACRPISGHDFQAVPVTLAQVNFPPLELTSGNNFLPIWNSGLKISQQYPVCFSL